MTDRGYSRNIRDSQKTGVDTIVNINTTERTVKQFVSSSPCGS